MPDARRKLPVVWIDQDTVGYFADGLSRSMRGGFIANHQLKRTVAYEPAVPRCRTCEYWDGKAHCRLLQQSDGKNCRCVAADDYCSEHPEARRG